MFRIAVLAALGVSLVVCAYFYLKIRRAAKSFTVADQPVLGVKRVNGVEESGFYNTEGGEAEPFRWTNGSAKLVVPLNGASPTSLHVRLGLGVPKATKLMIQANGTSLFNDTVKPQTEWTRMFDLSSVPVGDGLVTIEILSDTFIPARVAKEGGKKASKDDRSLGVIVRGVTLITSTRDLAGVNLAGEAVPGVEESGFYNSERCGGQPCRWTNGKARLVAPVPDNRRWKSLLITAEIPNRTDHRVSVLVNGRSLFDDKPRPGSTWATELPLAGVELGKQVVVELNSTTVQPGQTKASTDTRTLGIRLTKLMFVGD